MPPFTITIYGKILKYVDSWSVNEGNPQKSAEIRRNTQAKPLTTAGEDCILAFCNVQVIVDFTIIIVYFHHKMQIKIAKM